MRGACLSKLVPGQAFFGVGHCTFIIARADEVAVLAATCGVNLDLLVFCLRDELIIALLIFDEHWLQRRDVPDGR